MNIIVFFKEAHLEPQSVECAEFNFRRLDNGAINIDFKDNEGDAVGIADSSSVAFMSIVYSNV